MLSLNAPLPRHAIPQAAGFSGGGVAGLGGFFTALLTTFNVAILGNFSPGSFDLSVVPWVSEVVFILLMSGVTVVALNALIALLGDSYDRVQEGKTAKMYAAERHHDKIVAFLTDP